MELNEYIDKLFSTAKQAGFDACECSYSSGESMKVSVFNGEISEYAISNSISLALRGLFNGHMGRASTRILDDASIDWLVESAKSSAELIDNDDKEFLFVGSDKYAEVNAFAPAIEEITAREKIDAALRLEKETLACDSRIKRVQGCSVISQNGEMRLVNTLGLDVNFKSNVIGAYVMPIAQDGGDTACAIGMRFGRDKNALDTSAIAKEAASETVSGLAAGSCASGTYKVVLRRDVMSDMLEKFSDMFSADAAQHGLSLFKDREGEKIAADIVTIVDDPLLPGGMASAPFDTDGVATYTKKIVDHGKLTTLMHNLKTAYKQGVTTTGNASGSSVAPTNFYIEPGKRSLDEMLADVGDGILIVDVMGLHSGANVVSGDFSLGARGFMIENGKLGHPVKGITIAGNFMKLLCDVVELGSDLKFGMPGDSCFGAPSAVISSLSVAGE